MPAAAKPSPKGKKPDPAKPEARRRGAAPKRSRRLGGGAEPVQTKLQVSEPGDVLEQEADRVADRIVSMPGTSVPGGERRSDGGGVRASAPIQRDADEELEDIESERGATAQRVAAPKLESEEDPEEKVMRQEDEEPEADDGSDSDADTGGDALQTKRADPSPAAEATPGRPGPSPFALGVSAPSLALVQRQEEDAGPEETPEEEVQAKPVDRPRAAAPGDEGRGTSSNVEARVRGLRRGGGDPMPASLRNFMEPRFGADFGRVRFHHGPAAAGVAQALEARAFTVGHDIVFGDGQYDPHSSAGRRLIAHELTHVLQQREGLQSVQRQILQRDAINDDIADPAAPTLEELLKLFGMRLEALEPTLARRIQTLLRGALATGDGSMKLSAFDPAGLAEGRTDRRIVGAVDSLALSTDASGDQARSHFSLDSRRTESFPSFVGETTMSARVRGDMESGTAADIVLPGARTIDDRSREAAEMETLGEEFVATEAPPPQTFASVDPAPVEPTPAPELEPLADAPAAPAAAPAEGEGTGTGGGAEEGEAAPEEMSPASAEDDPNFQKVKSRAGSRAKGQRAHAPASKATNDSQDAAEVTPDEVTGDAAKLQVETIEAQEPPPFDRAAFIAAVKGQVGQMTPTTNEEVTEFADSGKVENANAAVASQVQKGKDATQSPVAAAAEGAPDTSKVETRSPKDLEPEPAGSEPKSLRGDQATPPPRTDSEVDISASKTETDDMMAGKGITLEQLDRSNEPDFIAAADAKRELDDNVENAPVAYREEEAETLDRAKASSKKTGEKGLDEMFGGRTEGFDQVAKEQLEAKQRNETIRAEVGAEVAAINAAAKTDVNAILAKLDQDVETKFKEGADAAREAFESEVDRKATAFYEAEYGVFGGVVQFVDELFATPPAAVQTIWNNAKANFLSAMDRVIEQMADLVGDALTAAKERAAQGREEATKLVQDRTKGLDDLRDELLEGVNDHYDDLEDTINKKKNEIQGKLAEKYGQQLEAVNKRLEEMKAGNQSTAAKVVRFLADPAAFIEEMRAKLSAALSEGAEVISAILDDPIGFLANVAKGVGQGFKNFGANIAQHLKGGVLRWLTGGAVSAGVTFPEKFDAKGIFGLILQLVGLTVENVEERARRIFGDGIVDLIKGGIEGAEELAQFFQMIRSEGVSGLFDMLKDKFEELKESALEQIRSALITSVIRAALAKIAALLTPVGAFVDAVLMIFDMVVFFVRHMDQVRELVQTVLGSIKAILAGDVGAIATAIERVLALTIPIVIGFLATLMKVGGTIVSKVKDILAAIAKPLRKALDRVLKALKKKFKPLFDKLKARKKKGKGKDADDDRKMSHGEILTKVVSALEKPTKAQDEAGTIKEVKKRAKTQERKFRNKVRKRTKLVVEVDESLQGAQKDGDVDFTAVIKSNTRTKKGETKAAGKILETKFAPLPGVTRSGSKGPVIVKPLTVKRRDGSTPGEESRDWPILNRARREKDGRRHYIRGHLLNQQLGGLGVLGNLLPITYSYNTTMEKRFEGPVKRFVPKGSKKRAMLRFKVDKVKGPPGRKGPEPKTTPAREDLTDVERKDLKALRAAEKRLPGGFFGEAVEIVPAAKGFKDKPGGFKKTFTDSMEIEATTVLGIPKKKRRTAGT